MKCNIPLSHRTGQNARDAKAIQIYLAITGFILDNEFDFTDEQLQKFANAFTELIKSEYFNKTLADEAEAWAKKHDFFCR